MTDTDLRGPWAVGGHRIAELRRAREITTAELAEQAGLPSTLWMADVEAGRRPVPSVFYKTLAKQLGMNTAEFAALCLKFYDPQAYEALFGSETPTLRLVA